MVIFTETNIRTSTIFQRINSFRLSPNGSDMACIMDSGSINIYSIPSLTSHLKKVSSCTFWRVFSGALHYNQVKKYSFEKSVTDILLTQLKVFWLKWKLSSWLKPCWER